MKLRLDALDCYSCINATYVSDCTSKTTCNTGEICFTDYIQTSHGVSYSLGCRLETKCVTVMQNGSNIGPGSIVGRSGVTGPCSECCKEQYCNRQLCQHAFSSRDCADSTGIHCATVGALVDMCSDIDKARTICRRFCGLCDYVNGAWSTWFSWSNCDVTCGSGTQSRTRNCTEPEPSGGGHYCAGPSQDTQSCTKEPCPIHGSLADWAVWGSCSATCGIGLRRRDRTCSNPYPARFGDHCFGYSKDDQLCLASACADGGWSSWLTWSTCSRTCGVGIRTRSRSCDNPFPSMQGKYCQGDPYQVEACNMKSCPVTNGGWGSWTAWTSCTASCSGGMQSRQRQCTNPTPSTCGNFCDGSPFDLRLCNQQACSATNGGWGSWTAWTSCTVSCGGGLQSRQRHCNNPTPSAGGNFCDGSPYKAQLCNQQECPMVGASRGNDGVLRFKAVNLNEGSSFNITSGIFTCRFPGLYVFTATIIETGSLNTIDCTIRRNYSRYVTMYSMPGKVGDRHAVDGWTTATNSATIHLRKGDQVYIYCYSGTVTSLSYSSFTGFLINTDP